MKIGNLRLTILSFIAGLLFTSLLLVSSPLAAQEASAPAGEKKAAASTSTDKSKKSRGAAGDDSNIKSKAPQNDPSKLGTPTPKEKTRGGGPSYCRLHIDSRVNAYVNIYVDGDFRGTVSPGGDAYGYTGNGGTTLYGRADFTDGSSASWGPRVINCEGAYNWTITP
jgi:hypothetical protein